MAFEATTNAAGVDNAAQVVVGLFKHANDAHQAVTQLRARGFNSNQIGAAFRSRSQDSSSLDSYSLARSDDQSVPGSASVVDREHENWWDKVKDAFRGEDNSTGQREIRADDAASGLDPEGYSRGEYEYDFAGHDFEGSLAAAGIPAERAAYLTRSLEPGGAIVTVRDAARSIEAEQILSDNHGHVRYEAGSSSPGTGNAIPNTEARDVTDVDYADRRPVSDAVTQGDRVQLFGEVLRVHKDRIHRGEARVRKEVITENQTIEVPVMREELVLERVAVDGNTPVPAASIGRGQEIRVPLAEEKVRLEKQPVLREEVIVGKREVADVAKVDGEVRHEELRVDSDMETPRRRAPEEELPGELRRPA